MADIRYVVNSDRQFWYSLDKHLPEEGFTEKVNRHMGYILSDGEIPAGLLRYNFFWDNLPFCTMLFIDWHMQGKGFGKELLLYWEQEMKSKGHGMVMRMQAALCWIFLDINSRWKCSWLKKYNNTI